MYLNELDYFVKHVLRAKYYIRYVDDFVILHRSQKQLKEWKDKIDSFLREKLRITLHPNKSRIIPIKKGIDFVGFRNFRYIMSGTDGNRALQGAGRSPSIENCMDCAILLAETSRIT